MLSTFHGVFWKVSDQLNARGNTSTNPWPGQYLTHAHSLPGCLLVKYQPTKKSKTLFTPKDPNIHCTKNYIYTYLLGENMVQKSANWGKLKAKMVNTTFVYQFTRGCKFYGKCGIYHLCPLFNLSLPFFAPNLH